MVVVKLNKRIINKARKLYEFGRLKNSIMKGKSNLYGAVGEIVVADYYKSLGKKVDTKSTFDYDLIVGKVKLDVKTKRTSVIPQPHYLCSVADFNTEQKCDHYVFVRVKEDLSEAYILGRKRPKDFYTEAEFKFKGDKDVNGWRFKADCYNLPISKLNRL